MLEVNINKWVRKDAYKMFSNILWPFYAVTFPVDVTKVREFAKTNNVSFYHSMIWLCTKAADSVPEFRYRIVKGRLVDIEKSIPSYTYLAKEQEQFQIITLPYEDDILSFCKAAKEKENQQKEFADFEAEGDNLLYISCLPWFDVTSLTNERNLDKDDMIPRIAWGKYYEKDGGYEMHLSLEVNHRTIDGYHIGKFSERLAQLIEKL